MGFFECDIKMEKKQETPDEIPLNFAMLYYVSLNKLIDRKDFAKINGDLTGWHRSLEAIYDRIYFVITKDDRKIIEPLFSRSGNILSPPKIGASLSSQIDAIISYEVPVMLKQVDRKLMLIMHKNNMIFPKIKEFGGLANLRKSYGIGDAN